MIGIYRTKYVDYKKQLLPSTKYYRVVFQLAYNYLSVVIKDTYPSSPGADPGETCSFPFSQLGKWYYSCRRSDTRSYCEAADGGQGYCVDKGQEKYCKCPRAYAVDCRNCLFKRAR